MDVSIVTKHPAATVGVVVGTILIVYLATRGKSSAASASVPVSALAPTQTGTDAVAAQYNAQIAVAQLGAQVAVEQTDAALKAQESNNATAVTLAQVTTGATTDQVGIEAGASTEIAATQAQAAKDIADAAANAQIQTEQIRASTVTAAGNNTVNLTKALIAGHYTGTKIAQIVAASEGQGPQAIAASQPSDVANSPAGILSTIAKPVTSLLGTLFG